MPAAKGNPEAAIVEECVANYDAVSLMEVSIAVHLTSIQPLYDRNARPATNNPTTTAAYFHDFLDSIYIQ